MHFQHFRVQITTIHLVKVTNKFKAKMATSNIVFTQQLAFLWKKILFYLQPYTFHWHQLIKLQKCKIFYFLSHHLCKGTLLNLVIFSIFQFYFLWCYTETCCYLIVPHLLIFQLFK